MLAEPGGADVAGMDRYLRSIVIEHRLAPEDIVELCLVLVVMIADGAARVYHDMGEHLPVAVQPLLVRQVLDVDNPLSALDSGGPAGTVIRACYHVISPPLVSSYHSFVQMSSGGSSWANRAL